MVEKCYHRNVLYVVIKKSRFIKEQESKGILSSLGFKLPLSKILFLVIFCFKCNSIE